MARIRSVKPELWTDPEFVECSLSARLLFIASWNFASDYGVIPNKPRQLKMQCLPADDCDVDALIEELVSRRFMYRAIAPNGDEVLVIRTFTKNQKINRATLGRWGDPARWSKSPPPQPPLTDASLSATPRMGRDNSDNSDSSDLALSESTPPTTVTPADIAEAGGKIHAKQETVDGRARDEAGLARWKAGELVKHNAAELERLALWNTRHRAWSGFDVPLDVLGAAALGDKHSLAMFDENPPTSEPSPERLDKARRLELLKTNGAAKRLIERPVVDVELPGEPA